MIITASSTILWVSACHAPGINDLAEVLVLIAHFLSQIHFIFTHREMKPLFLVWGIYVAANQCNELDPDYKLQATDLCQRFYTARNGSESSTSVKCVGNGAESIVYKCQTAENIDPPQVRWLSTDGQYNRDLISVITLKIVFMWRLAIQFRLFWTQTSGYKKKFRFLKFWQ